MAPTWRTASDRPATSLYRNLGNGKFEDVTTKAGVAGNGMFATGVTVGDYDNDGLLDIYVTGYGRETSSSTTMATGRSPM